MKIKNIIIKIFIILLLCTGAISCSKDNAIKDETIVKTDINGLVEKGPFIRGSVLTIYELNDNFSPTGRSFKTEILDDKGTFSLSGLELKTKFVQLTANGYYFNEQTAKLSSSTISLNAIAEVGTDKNLNLNILTHLEEKRVRQLLKDGKTFTDAKSQAQLEIYKAFFVKKQATPSKSEEISLIKDDFNSIVLLGISATMLNMAENDNAKLTELLSKISSEIENTGVLKPELSTSIKEAMSTLSAKTLNENTKKRYKELGFEISDFDFAAAFEVKFNGLDIINPDIPSGPSPALFYKSTLLNLGLHIQSYNLLEGVFTHTLSDKSLINNINYYPFYSHDLSATSSQLNKIHGSSYSTIRTFENIITESEKSTDILEKIYQYKSYPLIAYLYWQYINFFGDPFYVDETIQTGSLIIPRMNKSEVITNILKKLETVIPQLTNKEDRMADFGQLVAAKLSLELDQNKKAQGYINDLIKSGRYRLSPKNSIYTELNESLGDLSMNLDDVTNNNDHDYVLYAKKGKYLHYARYTEVILLAAEIHYNLKEYAEALAKINLVRTRNGKTTLIDQTSIISAIQEEYKVDMKNEGLYFSFLKRNKLSEEVMKIKNYQKIFPIPAKELMMNPAATQNPGY